MFTHIFGLYITYHTIFTRWKRSNQWEDFFTTFEQVGRVYVLTLQCLLCKKSAYLFQLLDFFVRLSLFCFMLLTEFVDLVFKESTFSTVSLCISTLCLVLASLQAILISSTSFLCRSQSSFEFCSSFCKEPFS